MNKDILFVRVYGQLVPIGSVTLVQKDPNTGKVVQEIPLIVPLNQLVRHNMNGFERVLDSREDL